MPAQLPSNEADGRASRAFARLVAILFRLLARLPLRGLHALGAALGWLAYLASPTYRRRLHTNLSYAGYTERSVRRAAIAEAGKAMLEIPFVWFRPRAQTLALIREVRGAQIEVDARRLGRGLIFLTPHIGCFELLSFWVAREAPLTVLYRPPKVHWLRPVMDEGRARENIQLAPTNLTGVRRLLRALRANEAIGLLPDQVPSFGEGEWALFFGHPAYTMTLPHRLQSSTNSSVIIVFLERLPKGRGYRVHLTPMPVPQSDEPYLTCLNRGIEAAIRTIPTQYLWGYNRYKGTPVDAGVPAPAQV